MSEAVSNAEIEDVLSSIRRLVSESSGPIRGEREREASEKLVLTPAFRVDPEAQAGETEGEAETGEAGDDAAPEAAVAVVMEAVWTEGEGEAAPEPEAIAADDSPADAEPQQGPLSPLEQRIEELEAAIARSATEFEPDGSEAEEAPTQIVFQHRDEASDGTGPDGPDGDVAAEALEQPELSEPDAGESRIEETAQEADTGAPAEADEWEDLSVEMSSGATGQSGHEPDGAEATLEEPAVEEVVIEEFREEAADEDVIDEEALREMVARMVREELQGPIGERITHNVRRMVRREIARALSLQDFE